MSKVVRITSKTPCIYTLKIELAPKFLKSTIWRLIEVDGRVSLAKLHHFIQAAFGWSDAHLHEYKIHRARYGVPDPEFHDDDYEDDDDYEYEHDHSEEADEPEDEDYEDEEEQLDEMFPNIHMGTQKVITPGDRKRKLKKKEKSAK